MKSIFNISILLLFVTLFSCSSEDSSNNNNVDPIDTVYPMEIYLDGEHIVLQNDSNLANPLGGTFGPDYNLLYGFSESSLTGRPVIDRKVEMKLAIPKTNVVVGEHLFTNAIQTNGYFADMDIKIDGVVKVVNTTSGKINVTSIDPVTNLVTGTFELTTNDGTNQNHTITGSFEYVIVD